MNMKHKLLAISSGVIIYIIMIISYNYLLNGNSDDILSNYIKMTEQQIENNNTGEEDVRIRMTKYFFTEFNDNILQDILGNGVNGANSAYTAKVNACGDRGLCITDVLYPNIFMFFGYIGLLIYGMLFWTVFRLKVSKEGLFARLYILYGLLIGFTNTMLLLSSFIFSMCLYVLRIESRGKQSISKMFIFWK